MKTRKVFAVFLLMMLGLACQAQQQVTEREAINAAVNTMRYDGRNISALMVDTVFTMTKNNRVLLYEVHFSTGESVLMSGSKACIPVLGFITLEFGRETSGILNQFDQISEGLQIMIESYADQIQYCFDSNLDVSYSDEWSLLQTYNPIYRGYSRSLGPLLTTMWGETASYDGLDYHAYNYYINYHFNNDCPISYYCPAGHPAVAMGQIMKYWSFPDEVYDECYTFKWSNMPDKLITTSSYYDGERDEIASLLKNLGIDLDMAYCYMNECNSTASENDVLLSFKHFGYTSAQLKYKVFNESIWDNLLQTDLDNGQPVLYAASDGVRGRCFVCHGYKQAIFGSQTYYYFNWGKDGENDGWYLLDCLDPDFSNYPFNSNQLGIFGISPNYCPNDIEFNCDKEFDYLDVKEYQSSNLIKNNNNKFLVNWGAVVRLKAETIELTPGFCANLGSDFQAVVDPCVETVLRSEKNECNPINFYHVDIQSNSTDNELDVDQKPDNGLVLYPNPTSNELFVSLESLHDKIIIQLSVIDVESNIVMQMSGSACEKLDVSNLRPGIYLIRALMDDGGCYYHKFIKL